MIDSNNQNKFNEIDNLIGSLKFNYNTLMKYIFAISRDS